MDLYILIALAFILGLAWFILLALTLRLINRSFNPKHERMALDDYLCTVLHEKGSK
jgi:hypothetical protein